MTDIKIQAQTVVYETGEKIGLAKPVSDFAQWAQGLWDKFVPDAEPESVCTKRQTIVAE